MKDFLSNNINEQLSAEAFSLQSLVFDDIYMLNPIIQYKRQRVRQHVLQYVSAGSSILELNCGTGEDAVYFAQRGFQIHATDNSEGMQKIINEKIINKGLQNIISTETCSFTKLDYLQNRGPYDLIFSNFGGLNCTDELVKVIASCERLLKPEGVITIVVISKFCLWESLLIFRGKFRTATRRLFSNKGRNALVEGQGFKCWYYHPSDIIHKLKPSFSVLSIEGLCSIVPPSYIENFSKKYPSVFRFLKNEENKFKASWPWKYIGDYFILSLRKNKNNLE
jgi:ubiquinone/menaquinone biosynthesis C-methylase UbiE